MLKLKLKKMHPDAILPSKTHSEDACWDVYACEDVDFWPLEIRLVDTGWSIEPPPGWRINLYVRSSTPSKYQFMLANSVGIIDSNYRGSLKLQLINVKRRITDVQLHSDIIRDYPLLLPNKITAGTRIGQIELVPDRPECIIEEVQELSETNRGAGGFGSTGN